jgi:hypothetical protein
MEPDGGVKDYTSPAVDTLFFKAISKNYIKNIKKAITKLSIFQYHTSH